MSTAITTLPAQSLFIHEAGHAVAAEALGAKLVEIAAYHDQGHVLLKMPRNRDYAVVLCAAAVAEANFRGVGWLLVLYSCKHDLRELEELADELHLPADALIREAGSRAMEIFTGGGWARVKSLVGRLVSAGGHLKWGPTIR